MSYLIPYSCRGRSSCPSCEKNRSLLWAEWLQQEILEPVPHRHVVATIPRLLRPTFRRRRELLRDFAQCASGAVGAYVQSHLGLSPPRQERPPPEIRYVPVDDEGRELEGVAEGTP